MSFLNKNIKKRSVFLPLLNSVENDIDKNTNIEISYDYLIPNNNKKYYLLITKNQLPEQQKFNSKNDMLHFFPEQYAQDETNRLSDFYLEIGCVFDDSFLLEGYLYKSDDKYEYLLTDILVKNNEIVNVSFELRYSLLDEIVQKITTVYLKNNISIKIHPVFGTFSSMNKNCNEDNKITSNCNENDYDYDSDMTIASINCGQNYL